MQTLHISDEAATKLQKMADKAHVSSDELIERIIQKYSTEEETPKSFANFAGALADSPSFQGDPVEIQRKMRNEWD